MPLNNVFDSAIMRFNQDFVEKFNRVPDLSTKEDYNIWYKHTFNCDPPENLYVSIISEYEVSC